MSFFIKGWRKIIIREIRLNNVGPFKGEHCLKTEPDDYGPVVLIGGMNGAGKTTIITSILLLLYGKRFLSLQKEKISYTKYLQRYMHNNISEGEDSWIELCLALKNNTDDVNLNVRRSWRINNGKIKENLTVMQNGVEDDYLASNWDTYVEELLPIGVSSLFFFDGEKIGKLAEEDENSKTLQSSIYSLLGLDLIDRLIVDLDRVISSRECNTDHSNMENEITELKKELEQWISQKNKVEQDKASINQRMEQAKVRMEEMEEKYFQEGGSFLDKKEEMEKEKEKLTTQCDQIKNQMIDTASQILPFLLVKPLLEKIHNNISQEDKINKARSVLPLLAERDNRLIENLKSSDISKDVLEKIKGQLKEERSDLECIANEKTNFPESPVLREQVSVLLERDLNQSKEQIIDLIKDYEDTSYKLDQVERQLHYDIDEDKVSGVLAEVKDLSHKISSLEVEMEKCLQEEEQVLSKIDELDYKYRQKLYANLQQDMKNEESKRIVRYALRSVETMKEFKEKLIIKKIDTLERNINEAFHKLIGKKSLISKIKLDPTTLSLSLYDPHDNKFPKSQLSEGEKQMLAIALLWGLARSSGHALPVIIDTPMARLDSSHRGNFVKNYLPFSSHQVIVLTTDEEINNAHLSSIEEHIGKKYLLEYDDINRITNIKEGYFC